MNTFIPLFAQSGERSAAALMSPSARFQPTNGGAPQPFHPITPPTAPAPAHHPCATAAAPEVTFQRNADRITQIRIQCSCGQVIVLDCEY